MTKTENWNPLNFQCPFECTYCPEEGWSEEPKLAEGWRNIPNHYAIWACTETDLFCDETPDDLITKILARASEYPGKCFIFGTKNPRRYFDFIDKLPPWTILATTVESDIDYGCSRAPPPMARLEEARKLKFALGSGIINRGGGRQIGIIIKPVMAFTDGFVDAIRSVLPDQVSIGREVIGLFDFPEPSFQEIMDLARALSNSTQVLLHGALITPLTSLEDWPSVEYSSRVRNLRATPYLFRRDAF